jgi:hypothetical protein
VRIYSLNIAQLPTYVRSSGKKIEEKVEQQTFRHIKILVLREVGAHNSIRLVEVLSEFLLIRISWTVHDI